MGIKDIEVTNLTFQGHVTSSITWPIDSPYAISYCCPIETKALSSSIAEISVRRLAVIIQIQIQKVSNV